MTQQREDTFLHCFCPHCRRPFDYVPVAADECPFCHQEISRAAVWQTRRYPGTIELPEWVSAFTWPLLVMLLGAGYLGWMYYEIHAFEIHGLVIGAFIFGLGLFGFLYKLTARSPSE